MKRTPICRTSDISASFFVRMLEFHWNFVTHIEFRIYQTKISVLSNAIYPRLFPRWQILCVHNWVLAKSGPFTHMLSWFLFIGRFRTLCLLDTIVQAPTAYLSTSNVRHPSRTRVTFLTLWRHLRVIAAVTWKHSLVPTWDGKKICLHELERVYHRGNSMFVDGYVSRLLIWLITFMSAVSVPASRLPLFMSENWFHPKPDNVNFQPTAVFVVGKLADGRGHVKKTGARL